MLSTSRLAIAIDHRSRRFSYARPESGNRKATRSYDSDSTRRKEFFSYRDVATAFSHKNYAAQVRNTCVRSVA